MNKTIVMKILEQKKVNYNYYEYDSSIVDGTLVAKALNENPQQVYKTLVTTDHSNHYFVFVIPVEKSLDLKKVAQLLNKKSIDMIKQKELQPLTNYVHGGCSPIGMKKKFPTYYDQSINDHSEIYVSGGRTGLQIKINVKDLIHLTDGIVDNLVM